MLTLFETYAIISLLSMLSLTMALIVTGLDKEIIDYLTK